MKERKIVKERITAIAIGIAVVTGMLSGCSGSDQGQTTKAAETTAKAAVDTPKAEGTDTAGTRTAGVDAYSVDGNLTLGTTSSTGTFYYAGAAIGNAVSNAGKLNVLVQPTNGSDENVAMCQTSDIGIGMGNYDPLYAAHNGEMSYKDAGAQDILEVASLYNSQLHVFVNEKSGITDISQLESKKVCVGSQGISYLFVNGALMTAYGISIDDIKPFYIDYAESVQALTDGSIGVAFQTGGYPITGIQQSAVATSFHMLPVDDALVDNITKKYSFIIKITIPAGIYENRADTEEIETLGHQTCLLASSKADEDQTYAFIELMMETLDTYKDTDDATYQISKKTVATPYIPFHPGTERYYREAGILK